MATNPAGREQEPGPIVSAAWLRAHLDDEDLRLIHVANDRAEYDAGHLPRAVFAHGYDDFTTERDGIRALVPTANELDATLGRLGITERDRVVVYASGKSPWPARVYWVLRYYHVPRIHIADRALHALVLAGLPVTTAPVEPQPAVCSVGEPDPAVFAGYEEVLAASRGEAPARVLDCRTDGEFRGEHTGSHDAPRRGRIPGALHLDWEKLVDQHGAFLPEDQLRALYAAAGITGREPVFPYCGGGIRSAVSWFAMHELLGWDLARNYDGSWAEWSRRSELPVEAG